MKHKYYFKNFFFYLIVLYSSLIAFNVCAKNNVVYDQINPIEIDSTHINTKVMDTVLKTVSDSKKENAVKAATPQKKFFGKVYTYGLPPADETAPCEVGVFKEYYVFGLKIYKPRPVMTPLEGKEEILTQEVVACGEEYVPKKIEKEKSSSRKSKKKKKEDVEEVVYKGKKRYDSVFTLPAEE
ncbi:hypothetical protein [Flavobacterium sp.]|uniref:hypothetical protein n=1 Tax=Flavobacterium sp. TaxID=239 RepID=UPI00260CDA9B|nr:hypothetical protein [Flavobacterium sp.]MDD3004563.1 hypothetical protein [Flavobacterium sp.]